MAEMLDGVTYTLHRKHAIEEFADIVFIGRELKNFSADMRFKVESGILESLPNFLEDCIKPYWDRIEIITWNDDGECPLIEDDLLFLENT